MAWLGPPYSLLPQQSTKPSLFNPQVWFHPALTETKELAVGAGMAIGSVAYPSVTMSAETPSVFPSPITT